MAGFWGNNDPLDPYLGVFGNRRLTGRGRGSPAGGLPQQARDASPFALTRERLQEELDSDPALRGTFDANTTAEVGTDPGKRRWYQALTIDRAAATGKPLSEVVNNPNYYPATTTRATATTGIGTDPSLWTGDNPANFATGNASYDPMKQRYVGFAGGPQTSSYGSSDRGSEYGGIEGGTMPYARAVGYTGPERTAIGPGGPRGNEDELTAGLDPSATPREAATYPRQPGGRKMPSSLMDFLNPDSYQAKDQITGQPISFGDAIGRNSNSLIGTGLGLLQMQPLGGSGMANALKGYQVGAALDQRAQALRQDEAHRKQAQSNWEKQFGLREREFARSDPATAPTEFTRAARDLGLTPGTPEHTAFAKQFHAKTTDDWTVQEDPNTGAKFAFNKRTLETKPIPIPGATATAGGNPYSTGGKMSTDEGKTALYADRAATAHADITKYENLNQQQGGTAGALIQQNLPAGIANTLVSGERGRAMDAQRAFINALLRRESGAAISSSEFGSYGKEYFPQVGDTPDQIAAKRKHRAEVIAGLARESGRGYRPSYSFDEAGNISLGKPSYAGQGGTPAAEAAPAAPPAKTKAPKPGFVEDGFVFKGGDPSKAENWAPVR